MKKRPLRVEVVQVPREHALRSWDSALDLLADAFAQRILDKARAEAAAELGLTPDQVAPEPDVGRDAAYAFQARLTVTSDRPFVARPDLRGHGGSERDDRVAELQYRDVFEYAVGHGVATVAELDAEGRCPVVRTEWIPSADVERVEPTQVKGVELGMVTAPTPQPGWDRSPASTRQRSSVCGASGRTYAAAAARRPSRNRDSALADRTSTTSSSSVRSSSSRTNAPPTKPVAPVTRWTPSPPMGARRGIGEPSVKGPPAGPSSARRAVPPINGGATPLSRRGARTVRPPAGGTLRCTGGEMHTFRYEHGPLPAGTVGPRDGRAEGLDLQRMLELRRPDRRLSAMDRRMIDRGTCSGADRSLTMR